MEDGNSHKVVCFGEVLWDILPSGAVPGGAPMNVAYHLHKQQKNPAVITSIGIDEKGKVYAKPNEHNEVVYDIVMPVAWDYIKWEDDYEALVSNAPFFVFGSL